MQKVRVDMLLLERGLVESRSQAQRLIMAGKVRINGEVILKPSTMVPIEAIIDIESGPKFVSRGGVKLEAALQSFGLDVHGAVCADVGASTGGFTDCLLQHGAKRVYAIDVGQGILHWKIRNDPRVVVMERTNVRYVKYLPETVNLIAIDVSFISLKQILPVVRGWLSSSEGDVLALIKPQFEAGKTEANRGEGVIRDKKIHQRVLLEILTFAEQEGFAICGLIPSPILGPKGNVEFFVWLKGSGCSIDNFQDLIDKAILQSPCIHER
jgi:23S rRNA (cytidine1920-2'-O)/16S rRNA (cytidine1409-2'-O)-methyltransferase